MPTDSIRDAAFCDVLNRELVCALGCTEPIAVAYAAALASQTLGCEPDHMNVACSGNIIKNVKSVTVPNSGGMHGIEAAAVLGAVGGAIHHIGNIHKYARREDVPEKTMFIITTGGYENASRRYSYETVRRMIERQKEKYGWEFLFLGANIDAAKEAARFGIGADRAVDYKCDEAGTALNYEVISEAVCCVRAASPLSADWRRRNDEDVEKRGR